MPALLPTHTDLVFNIVEQTLTGSIDGVKINARAGSGGRAGSKTRGAVHELLANNPYMTRVKKTVRHPGGPLPRARYQLSTHEHRKLWIRLTPVAEDQRFLHGRAGFAIHGRGPWGSDGCIVPMDFPVVRLIHRLVKAREDAGRPGPTLQVVSVGDFGIFDRLNATA